MTNKVIKKVLLLLFTFIVSSQSFAKTKKFDLNKDGVIDRVDSWKQGALVKRQEDRNGDGKFDIEIIYLNSEEIIKIEKSDTNFDGNFDRIKTYKKFKTKYVRVFYQVDKNFDQQFEHSYHETFKLDQRDRKDCIGKLKNQIDNFISDGIAAVGKANNGFLPTDFGYLIDQKCLEGWGNDFPNLVKDTIQTGLQCMTSLQTKFNSPSKLTAGIRNSKDLIDLVSESPVTIVCSEEGGYDWSGTAGHASTSPDISISNPSVKHPFISINPFGPKTDPITDEELFELKRTIFHENLHNLGYRHGDGIEFSYTCEACCFPNEGEEETTDSKSKKALACKICNGDYPSEESVEYLNDFVEYSDLSNNQTQSFSTLRKSLKENPGDIDRLILLAKTQRGVFNPIGAQLANLITSKNKINPAQESRLNDARRLAARKGQQSGGVIAKAMYEIYINQDAVATIQLLNNNKDAIKSELESLKNSSNSSDKYIASSIEAALDKTIFEVWINEYGTGAKDLGTESYELSKHFGFSD